MLRTARAAVCAATLLCLTAHSGLADDVTLTSRDGSIALAGALLGFDGTFYRIDTIYGELTVDGTAVSCAGPACPDPGDFVADVSISGSATMGAVLLPALIEGFARLNGYAADRRTLDDTHFIYELTERQTGTPAARFRFRTTTSDEGFADLLANEADMVMSLREIRAAEKQRAVEAGLGDVVAARHSQILALDAIVPIVAADNPVREMSVMDLARAFAGDITNWADLGGPDAPLTLHAPDASTGLGQLIADGILQPATLEGVEGITRHTEGSDVAEAVAEDPLALGVTSFAALGRARVLPLIGSCPRGITATWQTIKTGDYPLSAPMFLYLPERRVPLVIQEFLVFTRSAAAQGVIRRVGFVDRTYEEIALDEQGGRLLNALRLVATDTQLKEAQRMAETLAPMQRASMSFRTTPGTSDLDAQSLSNIDLLARKFDRGDFDARRILFVGFGDGEDHADAGGTSSLGRAEAVLHAVQAAARTADFARIDMSAEAFGDALPMACDDSVWGMHSNRRVEVWVQ